MASRQKAKKVMSLRPSWGFVLMLGGVVVFWAYTKLSHLSLPDLEVGAQQHRYAIELVAATVLLALTVLIVWQVRRFGRLREKGQGAVVVADMDLGKVGGVAAMKVPVSLTLDDLRHHAHFLGPTGSGKSVTVENVFKGFVLNRHAAGVFVDAKDGKSSQDLLETLPASVRDRIVLIRPDADRVVGLNVLQVLPGESEELVADQAVSILRRVLRRTGGDNAWGGRMDIVCSNGIRTLLKRPGSTLVDLPALLGREKDARDRILAGVHLDDPFVLEPFWATYDPKGQGVDSFVARLQGLLVRPSVRAMLGQPESIDLAELLRSGAIVLVDIPKARIGQDATALLGSFFVSRLWQVAQTRKDRRPVAIVLDEFQNFVADDLAEVLTESRAYNVGWLLANQFTYQLPDAIRHAVDSCALTKMRLLGKDDRGVFRAALTRRLRPTEEVDVVLRGPGKSYGRAHARALADQALMEHGRPRAKVEAALRKRLQAEPEPTPARRDQAQAMQETWELIRRGEVRPKPKECERCPTVGGWIQMHHLDYSDPSRILWLCPKCHAQADRERRAAEDPTDVRGFTDDRVQEMLDLRRQGIAWQAIADEFGLTYKQAHGLCQRRFPDDSVWHRGRRRNSRENRPETAETSSNRDFHRG